MSKCRVILVRHGETSWNKQGRYQGKMDIELSEQGLAQGAKLAKALENIPIDEYYASPLQRALVTAQLCADYHGKTVHKDARLSEIDHGTWEGMLAGEVAEKYGEMLTAWRENPAAVTMPEGENLEQVAQRSMEALAEIAGNNMAKTVLLAAHDATNKVLICKIMAADLNSFWQVKQDNTCINVLEYEGGKWRIVLLNYTGHMGYLYSGIEQKGL